MVFVGLSLAGTLYRSDGDGGVVKNAVRFIQIIMFGDMPGLPLCGEMNGSVANADMNRLTLGQIRRDAGLTG